jgi:hypothetical protein
LDGEAVAAGQEAMLEIDVRTLQATEGREWFGVVCTSPTEHVII